MYESLRKRNRKNHISERSSYMHKKSESSVDYQSQSFYEYLDNDEQVKFVHFHIRDYNDDYIENQNEEEVNIKLSDIFLKKFNDILRGERVLESKYNETYMDKEQQKLYFGSKNEDEQKAYYCDYKKQDDRDYEYIETLKNGDFGYLYGQQFNQ